MSDTATDPQSAALISSLQTPPALSKKYRMCIVGLASVLFVVILALMAMLKKPQIAGSVA